MKQRSNRLSPNVAHGMKQGLSVASRDTLDTIIKDAKHTEVTAPGCHSNPKLTTFIIIPIINSGKGTMYIRKQKNGIR